MRVGYRVVGALLLVLGMLLVSSRARGQAGTSIVRGTVTDPQGLSIANATVTIKNESMGFTRTQTTSATGTFSFELIPPADYVVEVEAKGFRKQVQQNVHALVGSPTDVSVRLELGEAEQTVTVEGSASEVNINTQDATLGNNFVYQQITQLPMPDRDVTTLLTLQPGVTKDGYVSGARSDQSNITLDGVDVNDAQTNALTAPVLRLNSEAIEEFRVNTVNSNASQGRSSAAQVNLVTKSGTNQFHGSVFEYNRNTVETANNFFNNRIGLARPVLNRNTFGPAIGGPIKKDKLFFFYSFEGQRTAQGQSVVRTVPLPVLGLGEERVLAAACATCASQVVTLMTSDLNNIYSVVGINPAAVAALGAAAKAYPANDFTVGDSTPTQLMNTAGYRFNAPTPANLNSNIVRLDWNINAKQSAFFRYNAIYDLTGQAPDFPDTPPPSLWSHPWGFVLGHTWTIGNNWVNNFRYGYTREDQSNLGDTFGSNITFRFIFSPTLGQYTVSRETPVHNIINDTSWIRGSHTIQFGTNIRLIANSRQSYAGSFDSATTNPSGYASGGVVVSDPVAAYLSNPPYNLPVLVTPANVQNVGTALIGRFSGYAANFIFARDGSLQPVGTPSARTFATQDYDMYLQDSWKMTRNLTITYGLRYGLSRPVYESGGFEVKPTIPMSTYLQAREQSANGGIPFNAPVIMDLSGPANGRSSMYPWDLTDFQPRGAFAWSPSFENGFLHRVFGDATKSVIRGGFSIVSDYFGEALATFFDLNNTLGFSASDSIPVNTYNVTTRPAPAFTGFGQNIRTFPNLTIPSGVSFPEQQPVNMGERIENTLDSALTTPKEYVWNFTIERQMRAGLTLQLAYIGRMGRHLLAQRDVMAMNDLVDPKSGMDWYTAATALEKIRQTRPPGSTAVPTMPYFDNIFPATLASDMNTYEGFCKTPTSLCIPSTFTPTQAIFYIARNVYGNDWTDTQADLDSQRFGAGLPTLFFQPQYGALNVWSTVANSNYNGFSVSLRQRYHNSLQWDFNYTYSHSLDDASGLQSAGGYNGAAFIENSIQQSRSYANSGFDLRHVINVNGIYQLPFGRGRAFGQNVGRVLDAFVGGWQLSGVFRWNTGLPLSSPIDDARWATNFEVQSGTSLTRPLDTCVSKNPPKLFGCNTTFAFQSFRNAYPGEIGMRNFFRLPGFSELDAALDKEFTVTEKTKLQLRWEVFNVANSQYFGSLDQSRTGFGIPSDPLVRNLNPPSNFSNFTGIQGAPRFMQIGLRFEF